MVILGLGSNIGDRLAYLRQTLRLIQQQPGLTVSQVSPVYVSDALLPDNAPSSWDTPYLNLALRCNTTLSPYELLHQMKNIEGMIGRQSGQHWGPRPIDIDLLVWDDLIHYDEKLHIPHECLHERPFALMPLADVAPRWIYPLPGRWHGKTATEMAAQWKSRFSGQAPLHTRQISQRIDTPELVGILNITPDSFSDGGNYFHPDAAMQQAMTLVNTGASILDVGAEATGPRAISLTPNEEWLRLEPILHGLIAERHRMVIPPKISVDTRHAWVAEKALSLGVDWINDVSGLTDPAMREVMANSHCDIVVMHQLGIPVDQHRVLPRSEPPEPIIYEWAEKTLVDLEKQGIHQKRVIVDIGIGYGKTAEQSLELLQQIATFKTLDTRLLIGHSRKSFLTLFTDHPAPERDIETLLVSLYLSEHSVDYLRLHNVDICARGFKIAAALIKP